MLISKNGKRLMAYIMSIAMLLTVLVYVPKTASAADDRQPVVTVLGASLRLDASDNNSKQSMRVAIKVNNADSAKACSIRLSINGKNYVVSTKNTGSEVAGYTVNRTINGVYSKDPDKNSVVYAVVVTGIPEASFYDSIRITGYADTMEETSSEVKSSTEARNVMGVVNALQAQYPDLGITIKDGTLTKKDGSNLSAADLNGYTGEPVDDKEEILDLSQCSNSNSNNEIDSTGITYDANSKSVKGENITGSFMIPIKARAKGQTIDVTIEGDLPENIRLRLDSNLGGNDQASDWINSIKPSTPYNLKATAEGNYLSLKMPWSASPTPVNITITKITVKYYGDTPAPVEPGFLDLSTLINDNSEKATGKYNSETDNITIANDTETVTYRISLPNNFSVAKNEKIKVTINGTSSGDWHGIRLFIGTNEQWNYDKSDTYSINNSKDINEPFTLTMKDDDSVSNSKYLIIKDNWSGGIVNFTINSIKVEKVTN